MLYRVGHWLGKRQEGGVLQWHTKVEGTLEKEAQESHRPCQETTVTRLLIRYFRRGRLSYIVESITRTVLDNFCFPMISIKRVALTLRVLRRNEHVFRKRGHEGHVSTAFLYLFRFNSRHSTRHRLMRKPYLGRIGTADRTLPIAAEK